VFPSSSSPVRDDDETLEFAEVADVGVSLGGVVVIATVDVDF